jgi:hypothetical protein
MGFAAYAGRRINTHLLARYQHRFGLTEFYLAFVHNFNIINADGKADEYKCQHGSKPCPLSAILSYLIQFKWTTYTQDLLLILKEQARVIFFGMAQNPIIKSLELHIPI